MWHPKFQFPEFLKNADPDQRTVYFSTQFILNHKKLADCRIKLQKALFKPEQHPILNVVGPTGVGKTELAKNLTVYAFDYASKNNVRKGLPAVYTEIPVLGSNTFDWKGLYARILENMNHPPEFIGRSVKEPEIFGRGRGYSERHLTEAQIRKLLEERIKDSNVELLIFDEVQHLFKFSAKNAEKSLDILKSIANMTKCQIVLIGTYESLNCIAWSGQLARRTENVHFNRYDWSSNCGKNDFLSSYMGLLAHVPYGFDESVFTLESAEQLYMRSCGCIGLLKQIVERAIEGKPKSFVVTLNGLLENSPSNNELLQMAREIREGEEFFVEETSDEIRDLLGMVAKTKTKKSVKVKPSERSDISKMKSKPGTRKPARDMVI